MQKLYEAVLGDKNSAYYLSKFQKFDQQPSGLQASWNLCAFFFNGLWALHRKMYSWFFVFWGVVAIKNITTPESSALLFVVPCIVFGIFADCSGQAQSDTFERDSSKSMGDKSPLAECNLVWL